MTAIEDPQTTHARETLPQADVLREIVAQMPMARMTSAQKEIVRRAIVVAQHLDLSREIQPIDVARADGFSDVELSMMTLFMNPAFNNGKIYLAPEFVRTYMIDSDSRQSVNHFYVKVLRAKYRENIDYFLLDMQCEDDAKIVGLYESAIWCPKEHQPKSKRGRAQSVFYAISGRCFKELIMQARTDAGKQLRDYYVRLEELVQIYGKLFDFAQMIMLKQQFIIQQREVLLITQSRQLAIEDAQRAHLRAEDEQHQREEAQKARGIAEHQREEAQREREIAERKFIRMRTIARATQKPTRGEWHCYAIVRHLLLLRVKTTLNRARLIICAVAFLAIIAVARKAI